MAAIGVGLCAFIVGPFVPGLVWAIALAVVADPLHLKLRRWLKRPALAAGAGVVLVALVLLIPTGFTVWQIGAQAGQSIEQAQKQFDSGAVRKALDRVPAAARVYDWMTSQRGGQQQTPGLTPAAGEASAWVQPAIWGVVHFLVALFTLFFFFRDREAVIQVVGSFMPMSDRETSYFFERIRSMTHATIYGTVVVALVQGALGGVMFAILGIPGALLWGVAMALLAIIPTAGAFVIWVPTAIVLAAQGQWIQATVLTLWGTLVVGTIDNVLYPALVGKEMRLHTLPVFLSIVGGLIVFGAPGLVLGPVTLAATLAMLDILKRRTVHHRSAAEPR
jgi:predicted PurR-regulated permease PerM